MSIPMDTTTSISVRPKKSGWRRKDHYTAWAFAAPALMLMLIFLVIPFFIAIYYSLTNARLVSGPLHTNFVGLANYIHMLGDDSLHRALLNNSVFGIVMVPVQTGLALLLAILVNQKLRGMAVFRTIYFSPIVTPWWSWQWCGHFSTIQARG